MAITDYFDFIVKMKSKYTIPVSRFTSLGLLSYWYDLEYIEEEGKFYTWSMQLNEIAQEIPNPKSGEEFTIHKHQSLWKCKYFPQKGLIAEAIPTTAINPSSGKDSSLILNEDIAPIKEEYHGVCEMCDGRGWSKHHGVSCEGCYGRGEI